jgi:hypothetical protein
LLQRLVALVLLMSTLVQGLVILCHRLHHQHPALGLELRLDWLSRWSTPRGVAEHVVMTTTQLEWAAY